MQPRWLGLVLLAAGCGLPAANAHTVKENAKAPALQITIPIEMVDCDNVLLSVVGAKRAVVGERLVLQASSNAPSMSNETDDSDEDAAVAFPSLLWKADDLELTVTGSSTADVICSSLGTHNVAVELAPPSPCPVSLDLEIECVEPAHAATGS